MDLINNIRRRNGCDAEMLRRTQQDPEIANTINALRANLTQALESLSTELYSKPSHFLLEFIQNAADNKYADDVTPTLSVTIRDNLIIVECNEVGFTAANVEAICRIGASTKKNKKGFIGEKGIGFKSVFRVADVVYICSTDYTFKLDKNEELGMITPSWTDQYPVRLGWTSFYLELSPCEDSKVITSYIEDIKPSLLLFLHQLRYMNIEVQLNDSTQNRSIQLSRNDINSDIVVLGDSRSSPETYLMVRHLVKTYGGEKKREGIEESEVVLAFPVTANGAPKIEPQAVHAFLPMKSFGFYFIIQADFLTAANREDILCDLPWNTTLRTGLIDAFLKAVDLFQQQKSLEFVWFRYLPDQYDRFFFTMEYAIISALQRRPIFLSADGKYRLPSQCIILSYAYCDERKQPLIPEEFLPGGLHYLSKHYDVPKDGYHFKRLGVRNMSNDDFLAGLKNMNHIICDQSDAWHESVCTRLYMMYKESRPATQESETTPEPTKQRTQDPTPCPMLTDIMSLCILPLSDGTWTSASSGGDIFFDLKLVGVPQDLDLRLLRADITSFSLRYFLFSALGVKPAEPEVVATRILELHRRGSYPQSLESLIRHARFLFAHRFSKRIPRPIELRVMDQEGNIAQGTEVYCDFPDVPKSVRLLEVLPLPAKFLHPDYLERDWWRWLRDEVGVNNFPRLIDDGNLSPEFLALTSSTDTRRLLIVLKETWSHWQGSLSTNAISRLGDIEVVCEDGSKHSLKSAYIRRGGLASYSDLPFLPIDDPERRHWDFLSDLGTTDKVDGDFFIKRLLRLQEQGCDDEAVIRGIYEQIQARFKDNPKEIQNAFDTKPLIFASASNDMKKKWIAKSDAIWTGPPSVMSKTALKWLYGSFQKLFHDQIGIAVAGPGILVDELKALAEKWKGKTIPSVVSSQVSALLDDISKLMSKTEPYDPSPAWLNKLSGEAIFPVDAPTQGLILRAADDHFYVPDNSGRYKAVFGQDVPILCLSAPIAPDHIKPVLTSPVFKSRLKHLGLAVERVAYPNGPRLRKVDIRDKYASKSKFIKRLVFRNRRPPRRVRELVARLPAIDIFTVDSIDAKYTLEGHSHTGTEEVAVEQDGDQISVLISAESLSNSDVFICKELAALLDVDMPSLLIIIAFPSEMVELTMKSQGIQDVPEDPLRDPSWIEGAKDLVDNQSHTERVPNDETNGDAVTSADPITKSDLDKKQVHDFLNGLQKLDDDMVQPARVVSSGSDGGLAVLKSISKNVHGAYGAWYRSGGYTSSTSKMYQNEAYRRINGILGECFVYSVFSKRLPGFGPENWTSDSRGKFPGLEPYSGRRVTHFQYADNNGALTCLLYDEETKEAWKDQWPTYHLEVASTSGKAGEWFYLDRSQFENSLHFTARDSAIPPKELYAIIRVSDVRTSPTYVVYRDPHRLFYEGKLRIISSATIALGN